MSIGGDNKPPALLQHAPGTLLDMRAKSACNRACRDLQKAASPNKWLDLIQITHDVLVAPRVRN
jgi:hypothetical protein